MEGSKVLLIKSERERENERVVSSSSSSGARKSAPRARERESSSSSFFFSGVATMCVRDVIEHTQRINENVLRHNTRERKKRKKKKREREVVYSTQHKETTPNTTTI